MIMEQERFEKTKVLVGLSLDHTQEKLIEQTQKHKVSNQEMLMISKDYASDDVRAELSQSLQVFQQESANRDRLKSKIRSLTALVKQPYFGRFDLKEGGERFYVGLAHYMDPETLDLLVYDWRAPVSSLFYEQTYGLKTYDTPQGQTSVDLVLKRHFHSTAEGISHYYDMDATPADDFLIEILSETSQKTLNPIVQSIQKKQNEIIRSAEVDLLNVQGVPGSGKSIIALHRMAYLLYHSQGTYSHENMVIISPNDAFKAYIQSVLPALGEKMNLQYTMTDLMENSLGYLKNNHDAYMDDIMTQKRRVMPFKNSKGHYLLLERWLKYYIKHMHPFEDFYFDNQLILDKHQVKAEVLKFACKKPLDLILKRYQGKLQTLLEYPLKQKFEAIEDHVSTSVDLGQEQAKLKRLKRHFYKKLNRYNRQVLHMDYWTIFKAMYKEEGLVRHLGRDLDLPRDFFRQNWHHDDYYGQMCLKLWIVEERRYRHVQYLMVDEAQDYGYMAYKIMKSLFYNAKVTLVGDVDQSLVVKEEAFFDMTQDVFKPQSHENIRLETCYRSTSNIVALAKTYMTSPMTHVGREGQLPTCLQVKKSQVGHVLKDVIDKHQADYDSPLTIIAASQTLCDCLVQDLETYSIKRNYCDVKDGKDVNVLAIYQAKGFEFDRVVYVRTPMAPELQGHVDYTAVTRAKHHVTVVDII